MFLKQTIVRLWRGRSLFALFLVGLVVSVARCGTEPSDEESVTAEIGQPSADQVPLDPTTIPKFAHELPIPRTFAPTLIRDSHGRVIRHEYTVSIAHTTAQMLPPGYPATTVRGFGGRVKIPGSSQTEFVRTVPGSVFENTRGIPTTLHWRDEILQPTFMPVDPTLHWANPQTIEVPTPPFEPFPPGYRNAQFPVAHVTHTHGLVVLPGFDGTAEEWFSPFQHRGPSFVSRDYDIPNEQPSTQLFYHDHVMGVTRLGVYAGSVGAAYFIRDPNTPLDQASSPLPKGQFEIPLVFFNRSFFTDGELDFPRESDNPERAYWQAEDGANTSIVNGKVWPNLNVQRRQYRFRMLAADNTRVYNFQFDNNGTFMPFTIIGSDGGYLPAPQVVTEVTMGITERADVLVDFSQLAPGTQVILRNTTPGVTADTSGILMRFTVQGGAPPVSPPPLPVSLFPPRPTLVTDAPARIKALIRFRDDADTDTNRQRTLDGLEFSRSTTEFPLVGSTEEWVLVHTGEEEEPEEGEEPDADLGVHQIHLHLIEFQVVNRQRLDRTAYLQQWSLINGHRPVTRQIPIDPTPYLIGEPEPALPYETGWKDTVRTTPERVTRIIARWAPQELATNAVSPGQNRFPFDPTFFPTDDFSGPGYVWHCHLLGHEDHEMMRPMPLVNIWRSGVSYKVGRVVAHQNVNYRVRVAHASSSTQPPNTRFDRWERVNNNDGTWAPQIIYAVGDRVLHNGLLFRSRALFQAQPGQTPDANPALWEPLPLTACGQLVKFCADDTGSEVGAACLALGQAGDEAACRGEEAEGLMGCLSVCEPIHPSPCSGLCSNPVSFGVPDHSNFRSGNLGADATCHETTAELLSGTCFSFAPGRQLTINGRVQSCNKGNWAYPLPPQRNMGYCIQTTAGNQPWAGFVTW